MNSDNHAAKTQFAASNHEEALLRLALDGVLARFNNNRAKRGALISHPQHAVFTAEKQVYWVNRLLSRHMHPLPRAIIWCGMVRI